MSLISDIIDEKDTKILRLEQRIVELENEVDRLNLARASAYEQAMNKQRELAEAQEAGARSTIKFLELLAEKQKLEKYKDILEEVGVITFTLTSKNENDPEQLLADIIDWHVTVATDPMVNGGYKLVKDTDIFGTAEDWKVNDD